MRTHPIIALIALTCTVGCTAERSDTNPADSSAPQSASSATPAPPANSASVSNPVSATWTVTPLGLGAIRVGMSVEELRRVGGDVTLPAGGGDCVYVHPGSAPPGVMVMLAGGQVARIDVDSAGVRTDRGAAVGDTEMRINELYAGRVTTTPHKYVEGAHYLTVAPASPTDTMHRIVFEAEGGRVARFRAGRLPEVSWVERCG